MPLPNQALPRFLSIKTCKLFPIYSQCRRQLGETRFIRGLTWLVTSLAMEMALGYKLWVKLYHLHPYHDFLNKHGYLKIGVGCTSLLPCLWCTFWPYLLLHFNITCTIILLQFWVAE